MSNKVVLFALVVKTISESAFYRDRNYLESQPLRLRRCEISPIAIPVNGHNMYGPTMGSFHHDAVSK